MALGLYEKAMPSGLTWPEKLEAARKAGFDYVEISIDETQTRLSRLDWTREEFADFRRAQWDADIFVRSMCLSGQRKFPFGSRNDAVRARSWEIFQKAVLFSERAGVRLIQLAGYDVYYEEGAEDTRARFLEYLERAVAFAAEHEVALGFETMETPFMDTVEKGMAYVEGIRSPYLGMYPDIGNMTNAAQLYHTDWRKDLKKGEGSLFALHLKETKPGQYRDMMYGEGHVDFPAAIALARGLGVRSFTAEFWDDGSDRWEDRLASAADYLRKWM